MNIVMIVSDSLRRDHLGCYGGLAETPNLDRLAEESAVFDRYYAASFPTVPARGDMHTGKLAFALMNWGPLPRGESTLAQRLTASGFKTVGIVDTPFFTNDGFNYDRGFAFFSDLDTQRKGQGTVPGRARLIPHVRTSEFDWAAPRTMTLAEQALERIYEERFFLYVDTWDPHEPWDPPVWYVKRYREDYRGEVVNPVYANWEEAGVSPEQLDIARACYAGEVTMVDRWVGRLLERVKSLGVADETAIVFTTDHGFLFGEHTLFGKMIRANPGAPDAERAWLRSPLYEELVHIPLLLKIPGHSPRRVQELVSAIDLMPTLLELAECPQPDGLHGSSVLPLLMGKIYEPREFVVSSPPLTNPGTSVRLVDDLRRTVVEHTPATISTTEWSLLYSASGEPLELYNLPDDPNQLTNVAPSHPDVVRRLHSQYIALLQQVGTVDELLVPRLEV